MMLAGRVTSLIEALTQKPKEVKKILAVTARCCSSPSQSSYFVCTLSKNNRMLLANRVSTLEPLSHDGRNAPAVGRVRRSVSSSSFPTQALFSGTFQKKLRLKGDLPNYLKASPNSSSLTVGPHAASDPLVCFKMHNFEVLISSSEGGNVVVIETQDGRYITKDAANSENVTVMAGDAPQQTATTDNRFFRMYRQPGDAFVHLKHLHSGMYLSATENGVSLHPATNNLPDSTLFTEFDCTHGS